MGRKGVKMVDVFIIIIFIIFLLTMGVKSCGVAKWKCTVEIASGVKIASVRGDKEVRCLVEMWEQIFNH